MTDNDLFDEKIIAVANNDPFYNCYRDISDVPQHVMDEIKHFFSVYKTLENKSTAIDEVKGRDEAIRIISDCIKAYHNLIEPKIKAERNAK